MSAAVFLLVSAVWLAASNQSPNRPAGPPPPRDYATFNVCQAVPGDVVARALGGTLREVRPFGDKSFSRCTYFIVPSRGTTQLGYAVWMSPPEDFEELKKFIEDPITTLTGVGDGAYMFRDRGDGRFKVYVLKRGDLMFQATGESAETARKVADAVVGHLWRKGP